MMREREVPASWLLVLNKRNKGRDADTQQFRMEIKSSGQFPPSKQTLILLNCIPDIDLQFSQTWEAARNRLNFEADLLHSGLGD